MGQRSVASDERQRADGAEEGSDDRESGRETLRAEEAQRNKRIKIRREQQLKKEAVKRIAKRKRMFKMAGIWVTVLIAAFLVTVWFSPDIMKYVRSLSPR
jgi:hypothetical protein